MKRIFKTATALVIAGALSASMFAFAACSDDEEHTHTYGEAVWTWSTDYSTAKATFTCADDDDTQEVTATVTSKTTTEATCTEGGEVTYTATAEFEGQTYTDTKTDTITAKGHTYSQATYDADAQKWYETCSVCDTVSTTEVTNVANYTLLTDDATSLAAAIAANATNIQLTDDIEITSDVFSGDTFTLTSTTAMDMTIDVAGNTLTISKDSSTNGSSVKLYNNKKLTFTDSANTSGSSSTDVGLVLNNRANDTEASCIYVDTGCSLTMDNIVVESVGCTLYVAGTAAAIDLTDSRVITTGTYVIGTNAATVDNYGVVITVDNSYLEAQESTGWSCVILINVEGTLNVKDSEIVGQMQGIAVRAGTATIENTTIICTMKESLITDNMKGYTDMTKSWSSSPNTAIGALVVGNVTSNTYLANAEVTLKDCTLSYTIENDTESDYSDYAIALYMIRTNSTTYSTTVTLEGTNSLTGYVINISGGEGYTSTLTGYTDTVYTSYSNGWVAETATE